MQDYAEWKLTTPGGVKFRLINQSGAIAGETASWTMELCIRAQDLTDLANECFPVPYVSGSAVVYPRRLYPAALPALECKNLDVRGFTSGRPIDPFLLLPPAYPTPEEYAQTYEPYLRVTLSFGPCPTNDDEPDDDPFTYLKISAHVAGEFLTSEVNQDDVRWQNSAGATSASTEKDGDLHQTVVCPEEEWTCVWPQIPFSFFHGTLVPRMEAALGHVNNATIDLFGNATAESILFLSYDKSYEYTWRSGNSGTSPVSATLHFLKRRFQGKDLDTGATVTVTHNHIWRPNHGWQRFLADGTNPIYVQADLRAIFTG